MISSLSFHAALDRTWPPAEFHVVGPWVLRKGNGGGKRVSAATANFMASVDDIPLLFTRCRSSDNNRFL